MLLASVAYHQARRAWAYRHSSARILHLHFPRWQHRHPLVTRWLLLDSLAPALWTVCLVHWMSSTRRYRFRAAQASPRRPRGRMQMWQTLVLTTCLIVSRLGVSNRCIVDTGVSPGSGFVKWPFEYLVLNRGERDGSPTTMYNKLSVECGPKFVPDHCGCAEVHAVPVHAPKRAGDIAHG
jgi:hypothetical protein